MYHHDGGMKIAFIVFFLIILALFTLDFLYNTSGG